MENDAQPTKSEAKHRWRQYCPQIFVLLVIILVFSFINKLFLADYFVRASEGKASFVPQIYLLLVLLVEATVPVFLLWLSKRRWYQYSLRTLMIVVTVFAIACSWFTVKMQQAKKQQEAVEAIQKWGRNVVIRYDWQVGTSDPLIPAWLRKMLGDDFFYNVYEIDVNIWWIDIDLTPIKALTQLKRLSLEECKITDDGLEPLKDLNKLRSLVLDKTLITDAGLEHLKGLTQLQSLLLDNTNITDAGLVHLTGWTQIFQLGLNGTNTTDSGLACLKGLSQLSILGISNTNVTDAGLVYLKVLPQLQHLDVKNTKVTDEGVKDLQKALPNLKIER